MLVMQQISRAWKRDEAVLRRFVEAVLWICRTGAPWRDLPDALGCWASIYHRWRRWRLRGWWELVFEALRPSLPAAGRVRRDCPPCKARRLRRCPQHGGCRAAGPQPWRAVLRAACLR